MNKCRFHHRVNGPRIRRIHDAEGRTNSVVTAALLKTFHEGRSNWMIASPPACHLLTRKWKPLKKHQQRGKWECQAIMFVRSWSQFPFSFLAIYIHQQIFQVFYLWTQHRLQVSGSSFCSNAVYSDVTNYLTATTKNSMLTQRSCASDFNYLRWIFVLFSLFHFSVF